MKKANHHLKTLHEYLEEVDRDEGRVTYAVTLLMLMNEV